MLKVLINSYACCPNMGSEPGMGWNWIIHLAQYCELYVISEGEYKNQCEQASKDLPVHWYWNPVSPEVRAMCWNQGDWRFYKYYRDWQKKTADIAMSICDEEGIDILHQLNMIGFREPGYLWEVSKKTGIPFVWGPIGGMKQFPMSYAKSAGWKMRSFMKLKNTINLWQIKHKRRVVCALKQASLLIASIPESQMAIKRWHGLESVLIPETGCVSSVTGAELSDEDRFFRSYMDVLWVGKFDFRKHLDIALQAIAKTENHKVRLKVYGTGSKKQILEYKNLVKILGIENRVQFMGPCSNEEVHRAMKDSDLFLFTSVSEDTSTVVLEAVSNRLPVLCFDICGMSYVIDEQVGMKVSLTDPTKSVCDFAHWMDYFSQHREVLKKYSEGCIEKRNELSWDEKAIQMVKLYEKTRR